MRTQTKHALLSSGVSQFDKPSVHANHGIWRPMDLEWNFRSEPPLKAAKSHCHPLYPLFRRLIDLREA